MDFEVHTTSTKQAILMTCKKLKHIIILQVTDSSITFDVDYVTHAAPLPLPLPKFLALIYPFDQYVWAAVFIVFVLYGFVFYLICKYF